MPFLFHNGTRLYWNELGNGPPILLIMGLSFTHEMWARLLPSLTPRYRAIFFDNRGMGRSDVPRGPYSMRLMASDAVAVLDAAGVHAAHIVGASMGGMIAQENGAQISGPCAQSGAWLHQLWRPVCPVASLSLRSPRHEVVSHRTAGAGARPSQSTLCRHYARGSYRGRISVLGALATGRIADS